MDRTAPQSHSAVETLCHEVRGAIAPLANWRRLLHSQAIKPEDLGALANVLDRAVLVLSRLANDLARLESTADSEASLTVEALDLREVVSSVAKIVAPEAEQKDVALRVQLPPEPVPMFGDFVRLTQVVANLLDNALKFTEGRGRVSVELRYEGGAAQLVVSDTGIGIAHEFLPLAFDEFAREDRRGGGVPGHGIGLHLVQDIVALHGGTVMAESPGPGCGSRFTVVLPVTVPRAA